VCDWSASNSPMRELSCASEISYLRSEPIRAHQRHSEPIRAQSERNQSAISCTRRQSERNQSAIRAQSARNLVPQLLDGEPELVGA